MLSKDDIILTPIFLLLIYGIAYLIKPKETKFNKLVLKYYYSGLTLKIIGALALGLIFEFYYTRGGDTTNYYNQSKIVTQAIYESPSAGLKLLLSNGNYDPETAKYSSQLYWYKSPTEFFVIKVAAVFGVLGLNVYSVIALFFAFTSFTGMWAMYRTFLKISPHLYKEFAKAMFFLPSVFFWGSGLMKDSITIGALGWLFYGFYMAFIEKKNFLKALMITLFAAYVIYTVKVYILLSFLPPALFWVFLENNSRIKNSFLRKTTKPLFISLGLLIAFYGASIITEGDRRYDLEKIGETSKINTIYLTQQVQTGSAYDIGVFDGSISSLFTVGPKAIIVSIFRPFLWEVRNPVMLLSAIEATFFLLFTFYIVFKTGFFKAIRLIGSTPILTFCFLFSLIFAFGVGVGSGNFGTLVRYKIPLMPFYLSGLYIMLSYTKRPKKLERFVKTA